MATEFICTIRSAAGDYTTLTAWEAANQCDLTAAATLVFGHGGITGTIPDASAVEGKTSGATGTATHVTSTQILIHTIAGGPFQSGEQIFETDGVNYVTSSDAGDSAIVVAECYNDWPSGLDDRLNVSGWTSDSTHYVVVRPAAGERHNGTALSGGSFTGFGLTKGAGSAYARMLDSNVDYTVWEGLITNQTGLMTHGVDVSLKGRADSLIAFGNGWNNGIQITMASGSVVVNCLVYDGAGVGIKSHQYSVAYVYNNTCIDNAIGITVSADAAVAHKVYNNLCHGNTTDFAYSAAAAALDMQNNASSDDTADDKGGTGNRIDQVFTFEDEVNRNLQLSSGDTGAKGYGTDLSSDSDYPFDDDITYTTRTAPWDIGAWMAVSVTTPVADFTASRKSGIAPLPVNFTDESTNTPTSWSWDFGDGNTSTDQNPDNTYTDPGHYTVTLTATNAGGSDTETKTLYIYVYLWGAGGVPTGKAGMTYEQALKSHLKDMEAGPPTPADQIRKEIGVFDDI